MNISPNQTPPPAGHQPIARPVSAKPWPEQGRQASDIGIDFADVQVQRSDTPSCEPSSDAMITVLTSRQSPTQPAGSGNMHKKFSLDQDGQLIVAPYQNAKFFSSAALPVHGIDDLAHVLSRISAFPRKIVIRGLHSQSKAPYVQRLTEHFPEHPQGTPWVMIDFDDIALPNGVDPLSPAAIEHCIAKLPQEFQGVTYYYQHSNSAGILNPDGTPRKAGLNAHAFFWLSRRIPGVELAAHLQSYCIDTGFYTVGPDKGGSVRITYGIDPSVIKTSVQAHYTAAPNIGAGVQCTLAPEHRQRLVTKDHAEVNVPPLAPDIVRVMWEKQGKITDAFKRQLGYKPAITQTKTSAGISTVRHLQHPNAALRGGRTFTEGKLKADGKFFTLYFADENSPGSYFVVKDRPEFACRHGGERMLLKELSAGAHAYVRDELKWFTEIAHQNLQLDAAGYLPPLAGFANAKASLILAPTSSGKTKAAIDWVGNKIGHDNVLVVYTAPTIALVDQMHADLVSAGVASQVYRDTRASTLPRFGVITTTNKSLGRILELVHGTCDTHYLIVDEIHAGMDEFMRRKSSNVAFENGLARAAQTLLLTGTLTQVQRAKIVGTVGHALGGLSEAHYCGYEFAPVKCHPLIIRPSARFDSDFMVLIESLAAMAQAGATLPRVVLLLDTSKMLKYRTILDEHGLTPHALVVSRPENTPEEIEAARISTLPILIASPLFALGLNFDAEPKILWAKFDRISADTNQIIQTINRANRGTVTCEVRIYGNPRSSVRVKIPGREKLKAEVQRLLQAEASLEGLLEEHFQIDPATYGLLRDAEKNSQAALSQLVEDDGFQNYQVVTEEFVPPVDKVMAQVFKACSKAAREYYKNAIAQQARNFTGAELYVIFWKMEQLIQERQENRQSRNQRTELEISNEESGLLMALCNLSDPRQVRPVKAVKLKRLFCEIGPWISQQYSREDFRDWAKVESEKTDKLVVVVRKLAEVRAGTLRPATMAGDLTRNGRLRDGILALANNESEYLSLHQKFDRLADDRKRARMSGGDAARGLVRKAALELLAEVLEPLGVVFARKKKGGKVVVDYDTLIVPATWDLAFMEANLDRRAQILNAMPIGQKELMQDCDPFDPETPVSLDVCKRCVFFYQFSCAKGRPVPMPEEVGDFALSCVDFKALRQA